MNSIIARVFRYKSPDFERLKSYGFLKGENGLQFKTLIVGGQMEMTVIISFDGEISTEVLDTATGEEFTLFLVEGATGSFIGEVKSEYESVLEGIAKTCFYEEIFKSSNAKKSIEFIRNTYGDELEFLWEKYRDTAIWRRKDNKKWYGILMTVKKDKLGLEGDEVVEILDIRIDPDKMDETLDNIHFFRAYHMNKKHWLTILLDSDLPFERIEEYITASYDLAAKK